MKVLSPLMLALALAGCSAAHHSSNLHSSHEKELTLGLVQSQVRTGMSQADVARVMGSPNIASKGPDGTDNWIYDKISTDTSYSNSSASGGLGGGVAGLAGSVLLGGGLAGSGSYDTGASATTQKTLTVIISFDHHNMVDQINYHSSKF